ncbi:capsular polysaccharide biosynthesis protein [Yoonia sp. SS1-5]|uniref:Capsular polysaccharide biosynthesis protein n=1 Tax=Yoonia rhodophyticola TaxID=3137370 RepID=A0AAN0NLT8_9RHOB
MTKPHRQNLFVYNGGFLTQTRVRRILDLAGFDIKLGAPSGDDAVGVWGQSPTAPRGEKVADRRNAPVIRVEDAFLRSVGLGRDGDLPLGLQIDRHGVHFDPAQPSDLELLLTEDPLDDTALLNRARHGISALRSLHLSKYNAFDPDLPTPKPGYVLVIDQTRKDASVKASGADSNSFREMLYYAQTEHPGAPILIKTHPETTAGHREGYFGPDDATARISLSDAPLSPWALFEGAIAVYTVSSQMGFEAILAGHKPVVFGQPFYIGWGLTDDRKPLQRRQRRLTRAQLFAAAMILYPTWYDPYHDRLCSFEEVVATLGAMARAARDDYRGWVASDISLWKRKTFQKAFGKPRPVLFAKPDDAQAKAQSLDRRIMQWASKAGAASAADVLVEDGFLRSKGLGADLIAPLSLVLDRQGIYYDATRPSDLETMIKARADLDEGAHARATALIDRIRHARLSKYNPSDKQTQISLPQGRRILVPGQVEDDASIRLGTTDVTTNAELLQTVREANPAAVVVYKPHPDVEAGLRPGAVTDPSEWADHVLSNADPIAAIAAVDEIWTMTSLLGFEALIHGKRVTCLGTPFYAGWGLTDDRSMPVTRRDVRVDLAALVHATLIDYPRYFDPVTGLPCPVEVIADRLEHGDLPHPGPFNRSLAKLQGALASYAWLWRQSKT